MTASLLTLSLLLQTQNDFLRDNLPKHFADMEQILTLVGRYTSLNRP